MHQVTLQEAETQLTSLVQEARSGGEVIITEDIRPVVRLVPVPEEKPRPQFGSAKNVLVYMADDFDAPLEDFQTDRVAEAGKIILTPVIQIPDREAWFWKNPEYVAAARRGLEDAAAGRVHEVTVAQHLDITTDRGTPT